MWTLTPLQLYHTFLSQLLDRSHMLFTSLSREQTDNIYTLKSAYVFAVRRELGGGSHKVSSIYALYTSLVMVSLYLHRMGKKKRGQILQPWTFQ